MGLCISLAKLFVPFLFNFTNHINNAELGFLILHLSDLAI